MMGISKARKQAQLRVRNTVALWDMIRSHEGWQRIMLVSKIMRIPPANVAGILTRAGRWQPGNAKGQGAIVNK